MEEHQPEGQVLFELLARNCFESVCCWRDPLGHVDNLHTFIMMNYAFEW